MWGKLNLVDKVGGWMGGGTGWWSRVGGGEENEVRGNSIDLGQAVI